MIAAPVVDVVVPLVGGLVGAMAGVATVTAAILAAVFALAACAKLMAVARTTAELERLAVPFPVAAARLVPAAELALVPALLLAPRAGATAAIAVLAVFTTVLVRAVRAGADATCGCFGSASREPISWATVARNVALIALAVVALGTSSPVVPDLPATITATVLVLVAAVAVQLVALQQRIGRVWSVALAGDAGPRTGDGPRTRSGGDR